MTSSGPRIGTAAMWAVFVMVNCASVVRAHPMVEDGLDVIISPDRITIDARISPEQILVAEGWPATQPAADGLSRWVGDHADYLRHHLTVRVDGVIVAADDVIAKNPQAMDGSAGTAAGSALVPYRLEYPLSKPPAVVKIDQNFLREFNAWSATCILRIRQINDSTFDTALLTRERTAEFECVWPVTSQPSVVANDQAAGVSRVAKPDSAASPRGKKFDRNRTIQYFVVTALAVALFALLLRRIARKKTRMKSI